MDEKGLIALGCRRLTANLVRLLAQGCGVGMVTPSPTRAFASVGNELKPWQNQEWASPEVSRLRGTMENVLEYHEDYDADRPVVCFDETSKQLVADKRPSIEARPGRVERYDTEYIRNGTRNLFMFCEPKGGWRHVEVTERRTAVDFAHQMKWLVDEAYPSAESVRVVLDNLNTHQARFALRCVRAARSAAHRQASGVPLHSSTRQLAQHGRDRAERVQP